MQTKIWGICGVGALLLGAQIVRSNQSVQVENTEVEVKKTKTTDKVPMAQDEVRVLSREESAQARKLRTIRTKSLQGATWVRVLPGGKIPASNGLTRSDNDWIRVPGQSRFGGTQLILGSAHQRSVATLKQKQLEIKCTPNTARGGVKHQHGPDCLKVTPIVPNTVR